MKGQREEEQLKLKEQFEGFDNFDLKANQTIVKQMDNQSADLTIFATRFPDVKKSFMEFLSKEVLKYIKIDTRNIEIEDLPMYFPEVKEATPEPIPKYTRITFDKKEDENKPDPILFSKSIIAKYDHNKTFNKLTGDLLKTFVKRFIIDAFGVGMGDKMKRIFKANISEGELKEKIECFNTIEKIGDILVDNKIVYKIGPISDEIENLVKKTINVENT